MKHLLISFFVLSTLSTSVLAATFSRSFSCMAPGHTGVNMKGIHTLNLRTVDGAVEVVSSKIKVTEFSFLINGEVGSSVPAFSASTKVNGDNDRVFSKYSKTSSKRITSIELTLSSENDEQEETVIKTSKGNEYRASCSFNGASGI